MNGFPSRWSFNLSNTNLTHESLVKTLNALPTTETALTLTIGSVNMQKLTATEIAIATAKGWTVA